MDARLVNAPVSTADTLAGVIASASVATQSVVQPLTPFEQARLLDGVMRFSQLSATATEFEYTIKQVLGILADLLELDLAAFVSFEESTCYGFVHRGAASETAVALQERAQFLLRQADDSLVSTLSTTILWNRRQLNPTEADHGSWMTVPVSESAHIRGAYVFHAADDFTISSGYLQAIGICADLALSLPHVLRVKQELATQIGHRYHAIQEMITLFRDIDNAEFCLEYLLILMDCVHVDRGAIWAVDSDTGELDNWSIGIPTDQARHLSIDGITPLYTQVRANGVTQQLEQVTLYTLTLDNAGEVAHASELHRCDSLTVLPLITNDGVVGAVALQDVKLEDVGGAPFCEMMASLAATFLEAQQRHDRLIRARELELQVEVAREIQQSLLPSTCPKIEGYDVAAANEAATRLGGDFHHIVGINGQLTLTIGDVSGKGVAAGLLMTLSRCLFNTWTREDIEPGAAMQRINISLCEQTPSDRFVTAFHSVLDPKTHLLTCWNAGHDPLMIYRVATGEIEKLNPEGMILGVIPDCEFVPQTVSLAPGDVVFYYTDGLIEGHDPQRREFGFARVEALLREHGRSDARTIIDVMLRAQREFAQGTDQYDDTTLIVLRRLPGDDLPSDTGAESS
ncbi:MAG: PP2C family protein-serine/threonine phosphatase [bacterium]